MIARRWLAVGALAVAAGACRHHASSNIADATTVALDSLTGIVSVTGTSYQQQLALRTNAGVRALTTNADDSAALTRLGGAEVVVHGATIADRFAMTRFVVRSVDGANVADGLLVRVSGRLVLRTRSADLVLGNPPVAFDSLVGARLWVGGPLDAGPNVYGVIRPVNR